MVSWGGSYAEAIKKYWIGPFTAETGVNVVLAEGPDLAKLKAQTLMGRSEWDVFDGPGAMAFAGAKEGFWAPFDPTIFASSDDLILPLGKDRAGVFINAGGIAYDPARHKQGTYPLTFADFFDVKKFPGKRALRSRISETLEMALIADGVSPKDLYPLDVERGFRKLEAIKPYVTKWVEQTQQTVSLLQNGEVDFSYVYSSRAKPAQEANVSIELPLKQAVQLASYYMVPKASTNKTDAMRFIAACLRPDRQAVMAEVLGMVPNSRKAIPLMSGAAQKWVPDMNGPNSVLLNDEWWSDHFDELQIRFKKWLLT
jgi:putative spermidine/putrescine transport system substrate-binding protein